MAFTNKNKTGPIADINVTPLVDVMLVLLVIFMISAPLMYSGIKLNLPKTQKVNSLKLTNDKVIISLNAVGEIYLGEVKILPTELINLVSEAIKKTKDEVVYIRADHNLYYGQVAKLMAELKSAGLLQLALVTDVEK